MAYKWCQVLKWFKWCPVFKWCQVARPDTKKINNEHKKKTPDDIQGLSYLLVDKGATPLSAFFLEFYQHSIWATHR